MAEKKSSSKRSGKPAAKNTPSTKATVASAKKSSKATAKKTTAPAKKTSSKSTEKKASSRKKPEKKHVILHSYVEFQQPLPVIQVFKNKQLIAKLKRMEAIDLGPVDSETTLEFKTLFRKTSVTIPANCQQDIQLSYNSITGKISAQLSDNIEKLQEALYKKDDKNKKSYVLICVCIAVILFSISIITRCVIK